MKINFNFSKVQNLGKALMLPIALLPVAGILLRFGQPDLLNIKFLADAGNVIFSNLALLFAIGVAVGLSKENNGTAALAACVGYLILTTILTDIHPQINTGVLGGIIVGLLASFLYNKYNDIELPAYLAFFGGKRFVPIITGIMCVILAIILGSIWPPIQNQINHFGGWLVHDSGVYGVFIYGVLNRILLITGLHHILNNLVWFVFGDYTNSLGVIVHGDIGRFVAGDKSAGSFMAGFFPIMMFGLPAACFAMYKNALPENKKTVAGVLLSMALTSFLTGVSEPIEFTFVFLAPVLFGIHVILTGFSMAIMYLLSVHLGFTFSAGLIDYLLFYKLATNPLYLLPIGAAFFILYYFLFNYFIKKYDLQIFGRERLTVDTNINTNDVNATAFNNRSRGELFIQALGGEDNIINVDSCMTRLRLTMRDSSVIIKDELKKLGSRGEVAISKDSLQVIVGVYADIIATEIRHTLEHMHNVNKDHSAETQKIAQEIINIMGGRDNISKVLVVALSRLRIEIKNSNKFNNTNAEKLSNNNIKFIEISPTIKQVYVGDIAPKLFNIISSITN